MSDQNRVFITGLSALTACGNTLDDTWSSILAGESGIGTIEEWDISSWTHQLGGELKQFQPAKRLPDRKLLKVISRQDAMGIYAAIQAVENSGLIPYRDGLPEPSTFNEKTAVYVGSPGNKYYQQYDFLPLVAKTQGEMSAFSAQLFNEVHPMWLLRILPNNVLAYTGITYGFKGINQNITNHAVSGTQAIIEAYHAIKTGQADRAVVVAYDVATEPQALFYYDQLGIISARHLKPFDAAHDGTIMAEGAGALVLESEASVQARQAHCYAEMVGGFSATEAVGLFSVEESGQQLGELCSQLMAAHDISAEDIAFVVTHGNGNKKSDVAEAYALNQALLNAATPITAFKWALGHTVCASGVLDAVLTARALQSKCIPGIANLENLAPDCLSLNATAHTRALDRGTHALMINRGYASMNAALVLKACE